MTGIISTDRCHLRPPTGLRLQDILGRIGNDQPVAAAGKVAATPSQWWRWC
jgi:hypothetical protein